MKIGVIGLGKLGLPLAALFSQYYEVVGVDYSEERVRNIRKGATFFEPRLNEYLGSGNLEVSTSYNLLMDCDPVCVIVQTPSRPNGLFNTDYVESALTRLHEVNPGCLAVVSSTVNIGTIQKLKNIHRSLAYNPEFIKQGTIIRDFENPRFVLIGADAERHYQKVSTIWRTVHDRPIIQATSKEAEAIKLILNFSYTLGITFANTIGEICGKHDLNPEKVLGTVYRDQRNYMPGLGYGGPCFPRDVACLRQQCLQDRLNMGQKLAETIQELNQYPTGKIVNKVLETGAKSVTILGVAYKQGVPYIWESQPLKIAEMLQREGLDVHIYDELAEHEASKQLPEAVYHTSLNEAIKRGNIVVIGTPNYSGLVKHGEVIDPWS